MLSRKKKHYYHSAGEAAPSYTNWWQGVGDVVPEEGVYTIYDPIAAASLADSYINISNPGTRNAAPGVAPTHVQGEGWTFNGTTQYLRVVGHSVFDPQTVLIWFEGWSGIYVIGSFTNSGGTREGFVRPVSSDTATIRKGSTPTTLTYQGAAIGGIMGYAGVKAYRNGVQHTGSFNAWSGGDGLDFYIGALNQNGSAVSFGGGKVCRVAIYQTTLTEAQVEAVIEAMFDYEQSEPHSYKTTVLSTNPVCYWPCNHTRGSVLFDLSGNKAHGGVRNLPVGQAGNKGFSIAGNGVLNDCIRPIGNWDTRTGFNLDECSVAAWVKITVDATNAVRVFNFWSNGVTDYLALEVRNGTKLSAFVKSGATTQDTTGTIVDVVNNQWHHMVLYNSQTAGKYGFYLDGVKYDFTRTAPAYTDTSPDEAYPLIFQDALGNIQHISFYDHALSQAEVDTLNV